jgi:hypothetical protein
MAEILYLTNHWVVSLQFCCNVIYFLHGLHIIKKIKHFGQLGIKKWGARRGLSCIAPPICKPQAVVKPEEHFDAQSEACKLGEPYPGNI